MPVLVLLGLVRAVALLCRSTGAPWRDAFGAFLIWQSTSLVVARASLLGLFARKAAFLVTPKTSEQAKWWEALRANWGESLLALLGILGMAAALTRPTELAGPLLAVLLLFPTLGMAAAPVNSWAAQRAALPPDLRERRTTEWRRSRNRTALVRTAAAGGVVAVVGVVAAAVGLLVAPSPRSVQPPALLQPAAGQHTLAPRHRQGPTPRASSPSASANPTSATASPTPSSSSPTPTPSASPSPTTPTPTSPAPTSASTSP